MTKTFITQASAQVRLSRASAAHMRTPVAAPRESDRESQASAQLQAPTRMVLTRRGKLVLAAAVALLVVLAVAIIAPLRAASSTEAPQQVEVRQVQPGDTLWGFAEQITPAGKDVQQTVSELEELNDMDTATLYVGQRIVLPVS